MSQGTTPVYTDYASKFIGWPILPNFIAQVNAGGGLVFMDLLYFEPEPPRINTVAVWKIKHPFSNKMK